MAKHKVVLAEVLSADGKCPKTAEQIARSYVDPGAVERLLVNPIRLERGLPTRERYSNWQLPNRGRDLPCSAGLFGPIRFIKGVKR